MRQDVRVIAVDFDGCICTDKYPEIGEPNREIIEDLLFRRTIGCKVILWTCRSGEALSEAIGWCKAFGLRFDAVNANLPENIEKYGADCRKVFADAYWDDRNVRVEDGRLVT